MAKFYNHGKYYIGFDRVGAKAYTVCDVFKFGTHYWETDDYKTFRIVFLRTRKHTYYWEISISKPHYKVNSNA